MCWFIYFHVVMQKDTPHARAKIAELPKGCTTLSGTFPEFTMPDGICGCGLVRRNDAGDDGAGIIDESASTISHFLAQPPVKRVEVWWRWGNPVPGPRPTSEVPLSLLDFLHRNDALQLAADTCYRITDPSKYVHA